MLHKIKIFIDSFIEDLFSPLQSERTFPLIEAAETFGGIIAGLTITFLSNSIEIFKFINFVRKTIIFFKISKFSFICFPYNAENEIHGFEYNKLNSLAGAKVTKVARGGFFGGPKELITDINNIYYNLMYSTLERGLMGTEESLFTIMLYNYSYLIDYVEINSDGLLYTFFENLKKPLKR